jgi:putative endonuclease
MPFHVYLLQSLKNGTYYIGQTDNLDRRLKQHNDQEVKSTKSRAPFKLIGYFNFETREEARFYEYKLKRHSGRRSRFVRELTKEQAK